jgi:hypothetical protein
MLEDESTFEDAREELLVRMRHAGLPAADVVMAILPDGKARLVWGIDLLEAIDNCEIDVLELGIIAPISVRELPVKDDAVATELENRYSAACYDAEGAC